jgi:hypothetical protein
MDTERCQQIISAAEEYVASLENWDCPNDLKASQRNQLASYNLVVAVRGRFTLWDDEFDFLEFKNRYYCKK